MKDLKRFFRTRQKKIEREHKRWIAAKARNKKMRLAGFKGFVSQSFVNVKAKQTTYTRTVELPENCCFIGNFEALNGLIVDIVDTAKREKHRLERKIIYLDMSAVKTLDAASINVLLTLFNYLSILGYEVKGKIPNDPTAKTILIKSGFFSHVKAQISTSPSPDTIIILGKNKTDEDTIGQEIRKIHLALTGKEESYSPLYTTLGEIAANSVEHANKDIDNKNWFMSVHYENDKALIMIADIGEGILKTLNLLLRQEVFSKVMMDKPHVILRRMFAGEYQSSTREPNRNTGLPYMVPRVVANYIENIVVVANNAVYDFSEATTCSLKNPFPGTFYMIEITKKNIETWQTRLK